MYAVQVKGIKIIMSNLFLLFFRAVKFLITSFGAEQCLSQSSLPIGEDHFCAHRHIDMNGSM